MGIVIAILIFGLIVTVHEFGHFICAKLSGIKVLEFSIGMGPKLLQKAKGETKYSLRLLPVGGYCAMEGEDSTNSDPRSFRNAKLWKRMIVLVAGAGMNFVLGLRNAHHICKHDGRCPHNYCRGLQENDLLHRRNSYILRTELRNRAQTE